MIASSSQQSPADPAVARAYFAFALTHAGLLEAVERALAAQPNTGLDAPTTDSASRWRDRTLPLLGRDVASVCAGAVEVLHVARSFYEKQGTPVEKIEGHIDGIDFDKPVELTKLHKGEVLEQSQVPG